MFAIMVAVSVIGRNLIPLGIPEATFSGVAIYSLKPAGAQMCYFQLLTFIGKSRVY